MSHPRTLINTRKKVLLYDQYVDAKTVKWTKSHHHSFHLIISHSYEALLCGNEKGSSYFPQSMSCLKICLLLLVLLFELLNCQRRKQQIFQPGKCTGCVYGDSWYIGNIVEFSDENHNVLVYLMSCKESFPVAITSALEMMRSWHPS